MTRIGRHVLADVSGADHAFSEAEVTALLTEMTAACRATLLHIEMHKFGGGQGMTAVAILAESHISMHEWPEYRFVAFDIFVCGLLDPSPAVDVLRRRFPGADIAARFVDRVSQCDAPLATPTV